MNKNIHRLVFDKRRGMRVPAAEHVRATGKSGSGESRAVSGGRLVGVVSALVISPALLGGGDAIAQQRTINAAAMRVMPASVVPNIAANALPQLSTGSRASSNMGSYRVDNTVVNGLDIHQFDQQLILNWDSFNVGKDMTVKFIQPNASAAVMNKIWDENPSMILGKIQANGEVILQNRNGFIFGSGARVNTASFVATALRMADDTFKKGWRNLSQAGQGAVLDSELSLDASLTEEQKAAALARVQDAVVDVQDGAVIQTAAGGDVLLVAPKVVNSGEIAVEQGTASLVAAEKVYLYNSTDASQRGLIVVADAREGASGVTNMVENVNSIKAEQGRVNLVGLTVRQQGHITATTAVKGQNGQIYLQAMRSTDGSSVQQPQAAGALGKVIIAAGSTTEVLPSEQLKLNDITKALEKPTQKDVDTFYRSTIEVQGKDIVVESGATVKAVSGNIALTAAESASAHVFKRNDGAQGQDRSSLTIQNGAVIDASGLSQVALPMSRNQLDGRLFSIELADSPVQRGGVLYRQEVKSDARLGVSVANVKGQYNLIERTAQELSTRGGNINVLSQGELVVEDGAKLNVSGGSVKYDAGQITSSLLRKGSALIPVERAKAGEKYDELITPVSGNGVQTVESFTVGADAGRVHLGGMRGQLGQDIVVGKVEVGESQRNGVAHDGYVMASSTNSDVVFSSSSYSAPKELGRSKKLLTDPSLYTRLQPKKAELVVGLSNKSGNSPDFLNQSIQVGGNLSDNESGTWHVSQNLLDRGGIGSLTLEAQHVALDQSLSLQLGANGQLKVDAYQIHMDGTVRAEGGQVLLTATRSIRSDGVELGSGDVRLGAKAKLDVSGSVVDERTGVRSPMHNPNGGKVDIKGQSVALNEGSLIDVSAGVVRTNSVNKGKAGELSLAVNKGVDAATVEPDGKLSLSGQLRGMGFETGGAKLTLSGVYGLDLGDATSRPAALDERVLTLDPGFFGQGGFTSYDLSALGDVTLRSNITPQFQSLAVNATRSLNGVAGPLASEQTLSLLQRPAFSLSIKTDSAGISLGATTSLKGTGHIKVNPGVKVDVGAGGSIAMAAAHGIEVLGSLVARGGAVSLRNTGEYGSKANTEDSFGYVRGQQVVLGPSATVDVSGIALTESVQTPQGELTRGKVLGGGTVSLNHSDNDVEMRGQVLTHEYSVIKLGGVAGTFDFGRYQSDTTLSAGAGVLKVGGVGGWSLKGTVDASRPNASVSGGQFVGTLTTGGRGKKIAGTVAYPDNPDMGVLHLAQHGSDVPSQPAYGEAWVSSQFLNESGFDRISLRADQAIEMGAGASIQAAVGQAALRSVILNAPVIRAKDADRHLVQASYVSLGNRDLTAPDGATAKAKPVAQAGQAGIEIRAGLIEAYGNMAWQGFGAPAQSEGDDNRVWLNATLSADQRNTDRTDGEIRLIGTPFDSSASTLTGDMAFAGDLTLQAGVVYASTLSDYKITGQTKAAATAPDQSHLKITKPEGGSTSATPLSALGQIALKADDIEHVGVIRQPFGAISLNTPFGTPDVADNSVLSVSGDGVTVPVGTLLKGRDWVYTPGGTKEGISTTTVQQNLQGTVVSKHITAEGQSVSIASTAVLDASAGGDVVAPEFVPGVGGSTDTLLRKDVFAVLPGYQYDFAPHDTDIVTTAQALGTTMTAGDQIEILTNNTVLAKGRYTLLPARYAVLPGAVLVSATTVNNANQALTEAVKTSDDGSVIVSGYKTSTGTDIGKGQDPRLALILEPEATFRAKSAINVTSMNQLAKTLAQQAGEDVSARVGDAGRISLIANDPSKAFAVLADLRLQGKADLSAGELDIGMGNVVVGQGEQALDAETLNKSGARSILLGGYRETSEGVTTVTQLASQVDVQQNVTGPEIILVAKDQIQVADGVQLSSLSAPREEQRTLKIQGKGAAIAVGDNLGLDVQRTVSASDPDAQAKIKLGAGSSLRGRAVTADASGGLTLPADAVVKAQALTIGTDRIHVGDQAAPEGALVVDNSRLAAAALDAATPLQRLNLRAYDQVTTAGNQTLGGLNPTGAAVVDRITLDAPVIKGIGQASDTLKVQAGQVVLRNTTGKVAAADEVGTGRIELNAVVPRTDGLATGVVVGEGQQRLAAQGAAFVTNGDVVLSGQGSLSAAGNLTVQANRVSAHNAAEHALKADNKLLIERTANPVLSTGVHGFGASVTLAGQAVEQAGHVDLASGALTVQGAGQAGVDAVKFGAGSVTDVSGRSIQAGSQWAVTTRGGNITAHADQGNVVVNGLLNVSAGTVTSASDEAKTAGKIALMAAKGQVELGGGAKLQGQAATASLSGALQVDTQGWGGDANQTSSVSGGTLDRLAKLAREGGIKREIDVRVRESGEFNHQSLNTTMEAIRQKVAVDGGRLTLGSNAHVLANAPQGGDVQMSARDMLSVLAGAKIEADSSREGANGGNVILSSRDQRVEVDPAALISAKGDDAKDGRVTLVSNREALLAHAAALSEGAVAPAALNVQAAQVSVVGNQVYQGQILSTADHGAKIQYVEVTEVTKKTTTTLNKATKKTTEVVDTTKTVSRQLQQWNESSGEWVVAASDPVGKPVVTKTTTTRDSLAADKAGIVNTKLPSETVVLVPEGVNVGLAQLTTDAEALSAQSAAILAANGLNGKAVVRAGVEVRSDADLTILKDINLKDVRPNDQALWLTLRANKDVLFKGSLSDGFATAGRVDTTLATTKAPTPVLNQSAATYRVAAGADLTSTDVMATQTGVVGDIVVSAQKLVRTTDGAIEMAAARDIRLETDFNGSNTPQQAVVYVAGRAIEMAENQSSGIASPWAQFTEQGGNLTLRAGRDIVAPGASQTFSTWFDHSANAAGEAAWWTAIDAFKQGIGSFGGGNVWVQAGEDIQNLSVVAPTSRSVIKQTTINADESVSESTFAKVSNGGDITIEAGHDILGGQFLIGRGQGVIHAQHDIGEGDLLSKDQLADQSKYMILGQMAGNWTVMAGHDLTLGAAYTPTLAETSNRLGSSASKHFSTYESNTTLTLSALNGDLNWSVAPYSIFDTGLSSTVVSGQDKSYTASNQSQQAGRWRVPRSIAAPIVRVQSTWGDVTMAGVITAPSASGDVSVYAGGSFNVGRVAMAPQVPDTHAFMMGYQSQAAWNDMVSSAAVNPVKQYFANNANTNSYDIVSGDQPLFSDDLHENDARPSRMYVGRDLAANNGAGSLLIGKALDLTVEQDIRLNGLKITAQSFDEQDSTTIRAGRDILGWGANQSNAGILFNGPGTLLVEAGRHINLGASLGVTASGGTFNTALSNVGSHVTIKAGANRALVLDEFQQQFMNEATAQGQLIQFVRDKLGIAVPMNYSEALAAFARMTQSNQLAFADGLLNERFAATYLPAGSGAKVRWEAKAAQMGVAATDYSSPAFQAFKDDLILREVQRLGSAAVAIADSTDADESAKRKLERDALWAQVDKLLDLAGMRQGFTANGDLDVAGSKIHTLGEGSLTQGGIDVFTPAGQQLIGLASLSADERTETVASNRGLITKDGGSIRSLAKGDFLINAQKAFVVGEGNLMSYSSEGSIDSGRGSNTDVVASKTSYRRYADGSVQRKVDNGSSGSGIGLLKDASGNSKGAVMLYAPRGEIRALDAFIRNESGGEVQVAAPKIAGADNIKGSVVGSVAPPSVSVSLNVAANAKPETAAGALDEVGSAQGKKKKDAASLLTVDVLSLGDMEPTAAGSDKRCDDDKDGKDPDCKR